MAANLPITLVDPQPRSLDMIFLPHELEELRRVVQLLPREARKPSPAEIGEILQQATFVIGQTDMPKERLVGAPNLRAIFNVEGNFLPNVDYEECFSRGIHVLNVGPVFSQPVAEMGLGLCIDLVRGITDAHNAFRAGTEQYGMGGSEDAFLLRGCHVGIIGFGGLGRAVRTLLEPFGCSIRVSDPWLPGRTIEQAGCLPCDLDELLTRSRVVFVTAAVTTENLGFLNRRHFSLMPRGGLFLLLSRASVVDFPDMLAAAASGHLRVAVDVFPEEPLAPDHPARTTPNVLLSPHRAGAVREALAEMGTLVLADVKQILRGLPPSACQRAERETVARMRSRPVKKT
jgi:phosphoglycerate dehydrogenase-like enzyme